MLWGLTLQQPWASAVAYGPKRLENRTWPPSPTVPFHLAIHAAIREDDGAEVLVRKMVQSGIWAGALQAPYPRGAIVAVCEVVECVFLDHDAHKIAANQMPWAVGPNCWVLSNLVALPEPVKCRGERGLWPVEGALLEAVRAAYRAARRAA